MDILIADDDREVRTTLEKFLTRRKHRLRVAKNGADAHQLIDETEPDLVISDVRMPEMDGIELRKEVNEHHPEVPVILITGHGSPETEEAARLYRARGYLKKPLDLGNLLEKIEGIELE